MAKNYCVKVGCSLVTLATLATPLAAQPESTISLFGESRHDIDYDTSSRGIGLRFITPAGLFQCDYSEERGETRVASFDNIYGIDSVLSRAWQDYTARSRQCGYGMQLPLMGGMLKAGIGGRHYDGSTGNLSDGKYVDAQGAQLLVDYERGGYLSHISWQEKRFDVTHMAPLYDSFITGLEQQLHLGADSPRLHMDILRTSGDKENAYTTPLFPANHFRYAYTTLAAGPAFAGLGMSRLYVAPLLGTGSRQGSYMALDGGSGLRGIQLGGQWGEVELRLAWSQFKGEGDISYQPVSNDMHEMMRNNTVSLGLLSPGWSFSLQHERSDHDGEVAIELLNPYGYLVGGTGDYTNNRLEDRWLAEASYRLTQSLGLKGTLYRNDRSDQQYNYPDHDYSESGGSLSLSLFF